MNLLTCWYRHLGGACREAAAQTAAFISLSEDRDAVDLPDSSIQQVELFLLKTRAGLSVTILTDITLHIQH